MKRIFSLFSDVFFIIVYFLILSFFLVKFREHIGLAVIKLSDFFNLERKIVIIIFSTILVIIGIFVSSFIRKLVEKDKKW